MCTILGNNRTFASSSVDCFVDDKDLLITDPQALGGFLGVGPTSHHHSPNHSSSDGVESLDSPPPARDQAGLAYVAFV